MSITSIETPHIIFAVLCTLLLSIAGFKYLRLYVDSVLKRMHYRKLADQFKQMIHSHVYNNKELYVLQSHNIELPLPEFQKFNLKNRYVRNVLSEVILELYRQYPGEKRKLLRKLYQDLDLELYLLIELNIHNNSELVESIKSLLELEVEVDYTRVKRFLIHKDPLVRKAARNYVKWKNQRHRQLESQHFTE